MEDDDKSETGFTESDLYWVNNNKSCQKSAVKFPTYDDVSVDLQINNDITLEMLFSDIESVLYVINDYEVSYLKVLKENKNDLVSSFKLYKLNYILFRVHIMIIKREVNLLKYLIMLKFEKELLLLKQNNNNNDNDNNNDNNNYNLDEDTKEEVNNYITKEYKLSEEQFINLILEGEMIKDLPKEDLKEIIEYLKKAKKNEELMIQIDYKPSITGLSILLKVLRSVIDTTCIVIKLLVQEYSEEFLLDFFHNVNK